MAEIRNHIDLDRFLAGKLVEWFTDPDESEAEQLRKACKLMTNFISNRPSFAIISSSSPSGAVAQFKYALDDSVTWSKLESELNEMSQSDLDGQQFPNLVHYLTLL